MEPEMLKEYYTESFFKQLQESSHSSAEEIVPLVLEAIPCNQIVDVGCGDGTWLKVFQKYGVEKILGVDGDYVDENVLVIPRQNFQPFDLTKALRIDKQFDLVMSLEVAEHLPAECAELFIDSLTSLGPIILFSAAIPDQGGDNHINEQWQEYWADKFQRRGYVVIDYIRPKIWANSKVATWYQQNILLFIEEKYLKSNSLLNSKMHTYQVHDLSLLSVVHPKTYSNKSKYIEILLESMNENNISLKHTLSIIPKLIIRNLGRLVKLS